MRNEDDRLPDGARLAARGYNNPPELSKADLDAMWSGIESEAFAQPVISLDSVRRPGATRWFPVTRVAQMAAVLLLGVVIGRFVLPSEAPVAPTAVAMMAADSMNIPEPYQATTSRYLGQTAALLVGLPSDGGRADGANIGRAKDLLSTTRMLLDSPAASDPRLRALLEDLELVLAQVVRLQAGQSGDELDFIRQALEQRDVLPRLRTAVADFSADD
ncbi:MAG TPA: hypothetical protein VM733_11855 [Thermoanaerobaculia bacterium]|nr:hypothetical protein [Thermoanaerobaculia bacterium]